MSITITLPIEVENRIRRQATETKKPMEEVALGLIVQGLYPPPPNGDESFLDVEFMEACKREADPSVTLEDVRRILAKVPGSLADAVIEEREERF
jgi:hypothetical protein